MAFRRTVAALADLPADSAEGRVTAANAAVALVHLALNNDSAELTSLLSPDPATSEVVWTVACYQIGGLIPSDVRDFVDPAEAIAVLVACPEEDHVAAELVASTPDGLRWTALSRTNDLVIFNLPDAVTATDASHEHPTELSRALALWRSRLAAWANGRSEPWDVLAPQEAPAASWERWPADEPQPQPEVPQPHAVVPPPAEAPAIEQVVVAEASLSGEALDTVSELVRSSIRIASLDLHQMLRDDLAEMGRALRADLAATEARVTCHLDRLLAEIHLQGSFSGRGATSAQSTARSSAERPVVPTVDPTIVASSIRAELMLAEARIAAGLEQSARSWGGE
jgi:hypothetical protein